MENRILFAIVLIIGSINVRAQNQDSLNKIFYAIEMNHFITGSGYNAGTEVLISVSELSRNLKIGFYYCTEAKRISGLIARHEIFLYRNYHIKKIQPHVFYNGIARITRLEKPSADNVDLKSGIYKTFEHHIGLGLRTILRKNLYLSFAAGYGVYFGSTKRPVIIEGSNEMIGSNGFSPIVKAGVGLTL